MKESTSGPEFLKRTAVSSLVSGIILGLAAALWFGWTVGAGFMAAVLWGLANVALLAAVLTSATHPTGLRKGPLLGWVVLKVVGLYGLGVFVLVGGWFPVAALAAGFGWPLAVALLRAVGVLWSSSTAVAQKEPDLPPRLQEHRNRDGIV